MTTFTYTNPTVGGSEATWGTTLNANWTALGNFIGTLDSAELAVLDGITATTAELNLLDGVTATTAELNILDGVTVTTAEINYLSGVTSAVQDQINNIATVPSGAVFHFAMTSAPAGYLKANGAAVSRTTYAALFAAIGATFGTGDGSTTFNLPDLRGEFLRGVDDGRGIDSGRTLGSAQDDEFEAHTHRLQFRTTSIDDGDDSGGAVRSHSSGGTLRTMSSEHIALASGGSPTGGTETRPRNVALLACIKV